jgi:hypothetical protein
MSTRSQNRIRMALGLLLAFVALNAFGGGYFGMSGAEGVPREWLEGSPFKDYFIPGLFLFVIVGGSFLSAAIAVFARFPKARIFAVGAAILVLAWLVVQIAFIGYVSWMQPATTIAAIFVLILARYLPGPDPEGGIRPGETP